MSGRIQENDGGIWRWMVSISWTNGSLFQQSNENPLVQKLSWQLYKYVKKNTRTYIFIVYFVFIYHTMFVVNSTLHYNWLKLLISLDLCYNSYSCIITQYFLLEENFIQTLLFLIKWLYSSFKLVVWTFCEV